jgi:hypothetical protein
MCSGPGGKCRGLPERYQRLTYQSRIRVCFREDFPEFNWQRPALDQKHRVCLGREGEDHNDSLPLVETTLSRGDDLKLGDGG